MICYWPALRTRDRHSHLQAAISLNAPQELCEMVEYEATDGLGGCCIWETYKIQDDMHVKIDV